MRAINPNAGGNAKYPFRKQKFPYLLQNFF